VLDKNKDQKEVITYFLHPLTGSVAINDRLIKYLGISSHCDKHFEQGITRELIIELVTSLDGRYFPPSGKQEQQKNYFKGYLEKDGKRYKLV
jgi:hypothetical protein